RPPFQHLLAVFILFAIPIVRVTVQGVRQLLPHERGMLAGRRLARIEQRRTCAPHHGRRDAVLLVGSDDLVELLHLLQTEDDHSGRSQLGPPLRRAVAWRLAQRQVQREQRGEYVVLKLPCARARGGWNSVGIEQVEERLLRVESRGDKAFRLDTLPTAPLDAY